MLKVGRQYLLPDTKKSIFADEDGTDFTFNQLSRLLPLPSVEITKELVESKTITPDMTLRQIEGAVKVYRHKEESCEESDAEEESCEEDKPKESDAEEESCEEDKPKEFTVAVEHAPDEELSYSYYTAEEIVDLIRTANDDGLILHIYIDAFNYGT